MPVRAVSGLVNKNGNKRLAPANRLRGYTTPAPVGGWNARDSITAMGEEDAVALENWFPDESWVSVRNGYASWATGIDSRVETLMSWAGPGGTAKLFAAADNKIYNVSLTGAVGAPDLFGLVSNRWQHTMFGTSAGNYLYAVNGFDAPRYFDGAMWTTPALTGTTPANMVGINAFKRRLFFIENDSLSFWYLPIVSVAGALTEFDLSGLCSKGGYLMAMGTWTRDGGSGIDDYALFVTSEGEVIIYRGSDPSSVSDWDLVGVFVIARPIGRRCLLRLGSDLIVITEDGASQISKFLAAAQASERAAMTDKITHAYSDAVYTSKALFGWQPVFWPASSKSSMVIINVPTATSAYQLVSNSTTGAWCKFTGIPAQCWTVHDGLLYFGGNDGTVYQGDTGLDDNGADITTDGKQAFSYFGDKGRRKRFAMARPNLTVDGSITVALRANIDFSDEPATATASFSAGVGAEWDVAAWDSEDWAGGEVISKDWQAIEGYGHCAALRMKTVSSNGSIAWNSTEWLVETAVSAGYI